MTSSSIQPRPCQSAGNPESQAFHAKTKTTGPLTNRKLSVLTGHETRFNDLSSPAPSKEETSNSLELKYLELSKSVIR
jgi:hypothetical protein